LQNTFFILNNPKFTNDTHSLLLTIVSSACIKIQSPKSKMLQGLYK
jgi:hypothetical protein